ncbi:MAG: hypothetical protein IPJ30_10930 [Acidobacteria bacterium]|nr:hypothetical protein [Acidobacteriota bacterium]MBK8150083.1 hypothetical protein [Acidobacteriota bacterium]
MKTIRTLIPFLLVLLAALGCGESKPSVWQKAKPVTEKLDHPSALIADAENLYFVTGGTVASKNEGTNNLMKMPVGGGAPELLFKGGDLIPDSLALGIDETHVYFSAGGLRKIPKKGGEAMLLTNAFSASDIVVDQTSVFWLPFVGEGMPAAPVYRVDKTGGEPVKLTGPRAGANGLCSDSTHLYWSESSGIQRVSKVGGPVETVHQTASDRMIGELQMDSSNFYFLEGTSSKSLFKLPLKGGAPVELAKNVTRFWQADDRIVFQRAITTFGDGLFFVSKSGGGETELDRDGYLASLATSGKRVFLSDISQIYLIGQ